MGYTTDFIGEFKLDKPLTKEHLDYLLAFAETRRMKRDPGKTFHFPDPKREAVKLPLGRESEFFVGDKEDFGGKYTEDILDSNYPPVTQPGLWCKWIPNKEGTAIVWNGAEKFYDYVEWLNYIIVNFLSKWDYKLNGEVEWQGEDRGDMGLIVVKNNEVTTKQGKASYS